MRLGAAIIAGSLIATTAGIGRQEPVWRAVVLAGESGDPLRDASLRDDDGNLLATSDAEGRLSFAAAAGTRLELAGDGRLPAPLVLSGSPRDIGVVTLELSAVVTGRLLDAAGSAVSDQSIWLVSQGIELHQKDRPEYAGHLFQIEATTAADGHFIFDGFWVGDHTGALLVGDAGQILRRFEAIPRERFHIGAVQLQSLVDAVGRVVDAEGNPVANARVAVGPLNGPDLNDDPERVVWTTATTDADGRYTMALAPGVYRAVALGGGKAQLSGLEVPMETPTAQLATIRLGDAETVGGRIVDEQNRPASGTPVRIRYWGSFDLEAIAPLVTTTTDSGGCWSLRNVPEGTVEVVATRGDALIPVEHESVGDGWTCSAAITSKVSAQGPAIVLATVNAGCVDRFTCEITWQSLDSEYRPSGPFRSMLTAESRRELAPGAWVVRASATGYVAEERILEVAAGGEYAVTFDLRRQPAATDLQFRVLSSSTLPAGLAEITLVSEDGHNAGFLPAVLTGADGRAGFPAVPPGIYSVRARRFGYAETARVRNGIELPDHGPAIELQLAAREDRSAQVVGRVTDSTGAPAGGASVIAVDRDRQSTAGATITLGDGSYSLNLPAGAYRLSAYSPPAGLGLAADPIEVPEAGRVEVSLSLRRGVAVNGAFRLDSPPDPPPHLQGPHEWLEFLLPAWTTPEGTYHVRGLPPGDWTFTMRPRRAGPPADFVVRVAEDLAVDAPTPSLELQATHRVSGRLMMHGTPLSGVIVRASHGGQSETDVEGRFSFAATRGSTHLRVQLDAPFVHEIDALDGDLETSFTVHGAAARGDVLDAATGQAIRTAELFLVRNQFRNWWHTYQDFHRVDGRGRFDFGTLPAGRWTVRVDAPGYTQEIAEIEIGDEAQDLRIRLEATPGARLVVVDPDGAPIAVAATLQRPGDRVHSYDNWGPSAEEVWWRSAPLGSGFLTVVARYKDLYFRGPIDNTGQPIEISLAPAGGLDVFIPADLLADDDDVAWNDALSPWTAQLTGSDGRQLTARDYLQITTVFELRRGDPSIRVRAVPPGEYSLILTGPDEFQWETRVTVRAGERARVHAPEQ